VSQVGPGACGPARSAQSHCWCTRCARTSAAGNA